MSFIKILFNEFWLYMRTEFLTTSVTLNILLPCGALLLCKAIIFIVVIIIHQNIYSQV